MTEPDLHQTFDARVWAAEFMRITGGTVDEETAFAWFANAIMCGWDHYYWQTDKYQEMVAAVMAEGKQ
jgi:hypothetical protein